MHIAFPLLSLLAATGCSKDFDPVVTHAPWDTGSSGTSHHDHDEDSSDGDTTDTDTAETGSDTDTAETGTDTSDTGKKPPEPWSFVVFGDNQFATESCTSGVDERLAIPQVVLDLAPTAVFHTGDLMDHGYDEGAYDQLQSCYADMFAAVPFFPTSGNHDMGSGGIGHYETYLEEQLFTTNPGVWPDDWASDVSIAYEDDPNTYSEDFDNPTHTDDVPSGVSFETFYAAKIKNAYLISFEQGTRWWTNTPKSWLESHLAAARADPEVDHIFVIMHHPMYSTTMADDSSDGECIHNVRDAYEDLFREYDVTIAFSGHAHVYEHFWVPDDGAETRADPPPATYPHDGAEVQYIVTGGGGGPLPSCPLSDPRVEHSDNYLQGRGCGYHLTRVQVEGHKLTVSIIGVEGDESSQTTSTWDSFVLE